MKTITKTLTALAAVLLVAGCAATAGETDQTATTWRPGWRHEQMVKAFQDGKAIPGPMMMRAGGPGFGRGPGALAADGKIDPATLPPWCPYGKDAAK